MFKQGISVPGLTLLYLFNGLPEKTYFTIFNEKNKDLHDLVKDNIVGGPSIIFHRYHEKGVTTLRQNEYGEAARPCRSIVGYGANALYLWSLMQYMPMGWCTRRRAENDFRPESAHLYGHMAGECAGTVFGMIVCDICVPEELREHFAEMQPVFKNISLIREDLGPLMRRYAEEHNIMSTPRRMLVGSYRGDKVLLATPVLRWYLDHGLEVLHVYQVIEYDPIPCFRRFGDALSTARREGDVHRDKTIIADTMKLLGNSGYGKTITNVDRHRDVSYCTEKAASLMVNDKRFRQLDIVVDDAYEIEMNKKTVKYTLPVHVGFFVLQYAKMRMLQFYYDFINMYVERPLFQYCEMDTDSAYLALAGESVDDLVTPTLRGNYFRHRSEWLPSECCDEHRNDYVRCRLANRPWVGDEACCKARRAFDKRTPGLFKVEWSGDGFVGLCSKTYYCFGATDKYSTKGLSKRDRRRCSVRLLAEGIKRPIAWIVSSFAPCLPW